MNLGRLRGTLAVLAYAGFITVTPLAAETMALGSYNASIGESSISGISSGAFMAVQFGMAWSSVIKGEIHKPAGTGGTSITRIAT